MKKTPKPKPKFLLIHNATLDGKQDEWRVSRLVGNRYEPFLGPFQEHRRGKSS